MKTIFNRRNFLTTLTKAGMLPVMAPLVIFNRDKRPAGQLNNDNVVDDDDDLAFISPPYLQSPTSHSMTIMWLVNQPSFSWVEYGLTKDQLGLKAVSSEAGLVDANNTVNKIPISTLQPSTKYYYRVCSRKIIDFKPYSIDWGEEIKSDVFSFETWPAHSQTASWLVFNDIHDRPESFPLLYKKANQPQNDFVFLNGDMLNFDTDQQQIIDHLLTPLSNLFAAASPFLYNRGNHETRGKFARRHAHYFDNPYMDGKFYYSYRLGPVHFIILDTGEDKPDTDKVYNGLADFDRYRELQATWLEKEMQTDDYKNAPFRVVMMHIPTYHSGDWHGTMHCRKLFNPLFNQGKIDLLISGHTHKYGTYPADPQSHNYPIAIGGGPKDTKRTVIKVNANRQKLALNIIRDDGEVVGTFDLKSKRS